MVMRKKTRSALKWSCYTFLLLIAFCLQTTSAGLSFFGIKPIYLIPVAIAVALCENEIGSAVFGLCTGFLWDIASDKLFGFFAIAILLCCVCVTLLSMYVLRVNITNAVFFCGGVCLLCQLWDFFFYYLIWSYDHLWLILREQILSAIVTMLFMVPAFYLVRWIAQKFQFVIRV